MTQAHSSGKLLALILVASQYPGCTAGKEPPHDDGTHETQLAGGRDVLSAQAFRTMSNRGLLAVLADPPRETLKFRRELLQEIWNREELFVPLIEEQLGSPDLSPQARFFLTQPLGGMSGPASENLLLRLAIEEIHHPRLGGLLDMLNRRGLSRPLGAHEVKALIEVVEDTSRLEGIAAARLLSKAGHESAFRPIMKRVKLGIDAIADQGNPAVGYSGLSLVLLRQKNQ